MEYTLTPLGHTLVELQNGVRLWAETNIEDVLKAQMAYDESVVD